MQCIVCYFFQWLPVLIEQCISGRKKQLHIRIGKKNMSLVYSIRQYREMLCAICFSFRCFCSVFFSISISTDKWVEFCFFRALSISHTCERAETHAAIRVSSECFFESLISLNLRALQFSKLTLIFS